MDEYSSVPAQWYDGITARRHDGEARAGLAGAIVLAEEYREDVVLPAGALVRQDRQAERVIYAGRDNPDFRLILPREVPPSLSAALPGGNEYGSWIDRFGIARSVLAMGAASAALVAAVLTAPDWLGPRIPDSWDRAIGDTMVGDIDNRLCHTPESDAALAKLLAAVDPDKEKVRAGIANIGMVNAVALPGQHVLLFDGIVQEAKSPDELAGVLAHEIGHVRERHVMTAMMRQFGLSILLAGADSGVISNASGIATMGYSRDAEVEADDVARKRLAAADISPVPTAQFFERMGREAHENDQPAVAGWLASHPSSSSRAKAFRAGAVKGKTYSPALTAKEFAALKAACKKDPDVRDWDFF